MCVGACGPVLVPVFSVCGGAVLVAMLGCVLVLVAVLECVCVLVCVAVLGCVFWCL